MLGRREIVDGKVGSRTRASLSRSLATWWLVLAYGSLFPPWIHWRTSPSLASGWQLHVADLQGGLRHRDQGRGCDPELRRRQGADVCSDYCSAAFHTEKLELFLVCSILPLFSVSLC